MDPDNGKFTILFSYNVMGDTVAGETLKLHFENILQQAHLDGAPLEMEPDALYKIVSQFGEYTSSDFRLSDSGAEGAGYQLDVKNSERSLPLCDGGDGPKITAATVADGALYLQGTGANEMLDNVVLRNDTGDSIMAGAGGFSGANWALRFDGVDSLEALKGYIWHYNAGDAFHVVHAGTWDFTFTVEAEDLTIRMTPNADIVWEGYPLTITSLEVSPYSLFLQYKTDEDTAQRMFPATEWGTLQMSEWSESYRPIRITMKDGSTIAVQGGSLAPLGGALGTVRPGTVLTEYESQYHIDVVIDPAQIDSIQIGDQTFAPNN